MPTPLRAAIYVRQSVDEGAGIKQQIADCKALAKRRGWPVVEVFDDNATSASKDRGEGTRWSDMLKAHDEGEFDVLVVTRADRTARRFYDLIDVRPPRRNIRIVTDIGGIDTDEPMGDYFFKQMILLAELELEQKRQRAERYARERRKVGHPSAGRTPHGYEWVPAIDRDSDATRYRINDDEAADVRRIYEEFLNGAALGQIARDLMADGRMTRSGARWHASTVRKVLMNPQYAALLSPVQETGKFDMASIDLEACSPGAWAPIVSIDELRATRAKLVGVKPNHQGTARKWLLSGLATCFVCQGPVRSARGETKPQERVDGSGSAPRKRYHAYRCVAGHFMRNGGIIDQLVEELCVARMSRDDAVHVLTPPEDGLDIGMLNSQYLALESREADVALLIAKGALTLHAAEGALENLREEKRSINDQLAHAVRRDPLAGAVGGVDVQAWWDGLTLAGQRVAVESLMEVRIKPIGYGRKAKTTEAALETVEIVWKR